MSDHQPKRRSGAAKEWQVSTEAPAGGLAPWMRDRSLLPRVPVDRLVRAQRGPR